MSRVVCAVLFSLSAGCGSNRNTAVRDVQAGVDPADASIVYDEPFRMVSGFKAYNGATYVACALCIEPKGKVVVPDQSTIVERHDRADVMLIYMEKRAVIRAHFDHSVSIANYRKDMGCAVKLEMGSLLIGTFGEYRFMEGSLWMKLLVLVPPKVEVDRRAGLIGGYGGRAGIVRPATAINPTSDDTKPVLTQSKDGAWLPPTVENGWHGIPSIADIERRASKGDRPKD